jgi:hypothetical protein
MRWFGLLPTLLVASSAGLPGTYATRIVGTGSPLLDASWRVQLSAHDYRIVRNGRLAVSGKLLVAGTTVTFTDTGGPVKCRAAVAVGSYTYSFLKNDGTTYLRLRVRRDLCAGRRAVLTKLLARV